MIRELKTFLVVAREGTFAAAGDKVGLTQAAVSAQMQRLESAIGCALFDRTGRSARLNVMGKQVLPRAKDLIRLYNNLASAEPKKPAMTSLSMGAIASAQRSFLPGALAAFRRALPNCHVRVLPGLSMELVNLVDAGDIDLAVTVRPPFGLQGHLHWVTLAREPFRLLVPRSVPREDWATLLSSQPFIRYERTSFGGRLVDRFLRDMQYTPNEICEVDELDAIVRLVQSKVGVALVPQTAMHKRWPAAVRALDLGSRTFYREIGLIHRPRPAMSETSHILADLIARQAHQVGRRGNHR